MESDYEVEPRNWLEKMDFESEKRPEGGLGLFSTCSSFTYKASFLSEPEVSKHA